MKGILGNEWVKGTVYYVNVRYQKNGLIHSQYGSYTKEYAEQVAKDMNGKKNPNHRKRMIVTVSKSINTGAVPKDLVFYPKEII
jgi:hypothetical protein